MEEVSCWIELDSISHVSAGKIVHVPIIMPLGTKRHYEIITDVIALLLPQSYT